MFNLPFLCLPCQYVGLFLFPHAAMCVSTYLSRISSKVLSGSLPSLKTALQFHDMLVAHLI